MSGAAAVAEAPQDDDVLVTIDDTDAGAADGAVVELEKPKGEQPFKAVTPTEGADELLAQLNASKTAEESARLERDRARSEADRIARENVTLRTQTAETQLSAVNAEIEQLTKERIKALEEGDYARETELTVKLQKANIKADRLESEKDKPARQAPAAPVNPVEATVEALRDTHPASAEWIRQHPTYVMSDGRLHPALAGAANLALHKGMQDDSPEYLAFIEEQLGLTAPAARAAAPAPAPKPAPRGLPSAAHSAPVDRRPAPSAHAHLQGNTFKMTPKMQQLAADSGVTNAEWAKSYLAGIKAGTQQPIE